MHYVRLVLVAVAAFLSGIQAAPAAEPPTPADPQPILKEIETWLGSGPNGERWRNYLGLGRMREHLRRGEVGRLAGIVDRLSSGERGLESERFSRLRAALAAWVDRTRSNSPITADAIRAAGDQFLAPSAPRLDQVRRDLAASVVRLDGRLKPTGAIGANWKAYLLWDELARLADVRQPLELESLARVHDRFHSGETGLELAEFAEVASQLNRLRPLALVALDPKSAANYRALIEGLAVRLERLRQHPEAATTELRDIGRVLGWLEARRQAGTLSRWVRNELSRPNLYVRVGERLVEVAMARHVDRRSSVSDCIMGTSICGTAHTVGDLRVEFIPDSHHGSFDAVFAGITKSRTLGANGPARIHSAGQTRIRARKRLFLDAEGLHTLSTSSRATTSNRIVGIGSTAPGLRGRLVRRIASRKAGQAQGQAQAIASRHAEQQFNEQFDREAVTQLSEARRTFRERLRRPLVARNQYPRQLLFSTTTDFLNVVGEQAGPSQLAAQTAPPEIVGVPALSLRIHESAVNNTFFGFLAGETFTEEKTKELLVDLLGQVPPEFESDADQEPWSITFDANEPVTVKFDDGHLAITVRGTRYTSGDGRYGAMNVSTKYRFDNGAHGVVLRRDEELEILPPGFVPGSGQKLGLRQTTLRSLLKRRFEKLFPPEIEIDGFSLADKLESLGTFVVTQSTAEAGWLALGWRTDSMAAISPPDHDSPGQSPTNTTERALLARLAVGCVLGF